MNLKEIEETVVALQSRHANVDEQMLTTLLRSGGWEENDIRDALVIFRSGASAETARTPLPLVEEEGDYELPPSRELIDHTESVLATDVVVSLPVAESASLLPNNEGNTSSSIVEELISHGVTLPVEAVSLVEVDLPKEEHIIEDVALPVDVMVSSTSQEAQEVKHFFTRREEVVAIVAFVIVLVILNILGYIYK